MTLAKLLLMILVTGATATGLLVVRQQRLEAAYELAAVHERLLQDQRLLWTLQCDVAALCRTQSVREMLGRLDVDWTALPDPASVDADAPALSIALETMTP